MKALKWFLLLSGIWTIGLGITAFFRPLDGLAALGIFFGIGILISGISEIASFIGAEKGSRTGMMLASGIMSTLFGIWVIFGRGTDVIIYILLFVFAAWVMASGIARIVDAVSKKPVIANSGGAAVIAYEGKINIWGLILGILSTFAGFALMFNPFMSARIITFVMAFMFISFGIGSIQLFFHLRKLEKEVKAQVIDVVETK